ncbi:hypothetical protein NUACC26_078590 [Scytonema sp. NUACC26]
MVTYYVKILILDILNVIYLTLLLDLGILSHCKRLTTVLFRDSFIAFVGAQCLAPLP